MRCVIACGGFGIISGISVGDDLKRLRLLVTLRKKGLVFSGNIVSLCRITCDASLYEYIRTRSGRGTGILILSEKDAGVKKEKKRLKNATVRLKELVAAVSSDELFPLIDKKPEAFSIMTSDEEITFLDEMDAERI